MPTMIGYDWIRGWSGMRIFTHSALFMALVHQVRPSQTIQATQTVKALRREYDFFNPLWRAILSCAAWAWPISCG